MESDSNGCSSHSESVILYCSFSEPHNAVYTLLGSTVVGNKDICNIENVRHLCSKERRSVVFCAKCGHFWFGSRLSAREKKMKVWLRSSSNWKHTTGTFCKNENWIMYKIALSRWTKACELVAVISDKDDLIFSLYLKDSAVNLENNLYRVDNSADIKTIISVFFPKLVPLRVPEAESAVRGKEDIEGFFQSLRHETPKLWEICTKNIVADLRPYQEDAIRFMISREDFGQQITFNIENNFTVLPTTPPVLYSQATGSMSRQLHAPSSCICPPGGILADEMGLGKTLEVIGLILSHQRGKGLPQIGSNLARQHDPVKVIVNELVSTVVAAIDGYSALQNTIDSKCRQMYYYDKLEPNVPKKRKRERYVVEPLTVTCLSCNTVCSQERVYWDRFRSQDIPFLCPECIDDQGKVYSIKGTFIVAPLAICHQWYEEIRRHIRDDLKIDMYHGLVNDGYKHPEYLATQDIVICSFEVLRSEIYFLKARPRLDSLRRNKRHRIAPTPLLAVEWWRICIDEAQMVENSSSNVATMCEGLMAVNRWCVTGTPITNSLQDLYGFVRFLRIEPFWNECWWRNALMEPYRCGNKEPIIDLFSKIMWRNTKKIVSDQMLSPPKKSDLTVLRFTPIEEQFYRESLSNCRSKAFHLSYLRNVDLPISSLHGKDFERIMEPLQLLRKFIVLPSLRLEESKQIVNTEESLQEILFRTSTQQAEIHQRNILMHYSGLAGLEWLCGHLNDAAHFYNSAVLAMKELDEVNRKLDLGGSKGAYRQLRSDKLQQIHIYSAILDLQGNGYEIKSVDRKDAEAQLNLAFTGYTEQAVSNLTFSYIAVKEASAKFRDILWKMKLDVGWMLEATNLITNIGLQHVFIDAVRTVLDNNALPSVPASNLRGLTFFIMKRWNELLECARKVFLETEKIARNNILEKKSTLILEGIIACHFPPDDSKPLRSCPLCIYNKHINQLESHLFIKNKKMSTNEDDNNKGTAGQQKISSLELILRTILGTFIRMQKEGTSDLIGFGKKTVAHLEEFKSLLTLAKRLYATANEYAAKFQDKCLKISYCFIDEVRQCKLRLQYATKEDITKYRVHLPINLIIQGTEEKKRSSDLVALDMEKMKLTRCLAKLRYLSNLRTQQTHECPVCLLALKDSWVVYPCAHCVCVSCFNAISRRSGLINRQNSVLKCVFCRAAAYVSQISYVQNTSVARTAHLLDDPNVHLRRSVSVKVDAIMRRIKSIRLRDPTSKTLLFTSLSVLIKPLCRVMSENDITFRNFLGTNRQKILADFRLNPEIEVLIMPMSLGARGLNLTAANNIIFLEPQMDVSQIAQAIGRIDRIGQKKKMMIHHFVVYGSIEEQIYYKYAQDNDKDWTVQSIVQLLGIAEEQEDVLIVD